MKSAQEPLHLLLAHAVYFDDLAPARLPGHDPHFRFGNAQSLSDEFHERSVRGTVDRWRRKADFDATVMHPRDFGAVGARLDMDFDACAHQALES